MSNWNISANIISLHGDTNFREITTYLYKKINEKLSIKHNLEKKVTGCNTLCIRCIPISCLNQENVYPMLYEDITNDEKNIYLYIYILQTDSPIKYNDKYKYDAKPKYYLTISNILTKIILEKKINKLKHFINANRLPEIVEHYENKQNIITENVKLSPVMADQNITVFDYINTIMLENQK